ncbi:MAG: hypothetical protein E7327_04895 [Clostridiales bacterium]|nr:hypothetical protein [Clostridiales bacterium]
MKNDENRREGLVLRSGIAVSFFLAGLVFGFFLQFFLLFLPPYWQNTIRVLYVAALAVLSLLVGGAARAKWFRYVLAAFGAVVMGCSVYAGVQLHEETLPVLDDRSLMMTQYYPFSGEKTTALPEEATLRFTKEQADSFVIDGATALYPVYAAFVQAVYPEGTYRHRDYFSGDGPETVLCSGTNIAYQDLFRGDADVIFVAEPSEKQRQAAADAGLQLHMTPIGREAFVFFVNSKNPVTGLTFGEVAGIYSGEITNWKDVGGRNRSIRAYQRSEGSGSQTGLQLLMRMADKPIMSPRTEDVVGDMGGIITRVAAYRNHENAIGYTYRFYANEMVANDQIRLLSLNGVAPTKDTIRDGSYPMASFFYAVTASPIGEPAPQETNASLGAFLDWCRGPQGQWLVEAVGYVSAE